MKNLIYTLALLISFSSFGQNLYKDLSSEMTFADALKELKDNYSTKYTNIKLGDFEHLFNINFDYSRDLSKEPLTSFYSLNLYTGLYHTKGKLVGVQMTTTSSFDQIYKETQQLKDFFVDKNYQIESVLGNYVRNKLQYDSYTGSHLVHLMKGDLNLIINYRCLDNNEFLFQITLFNNINNKYFETIIGSPEVVDDGF